MDIIYKTGSILDATEPYIVHGCNAQGSMGSGVAKVLMDRYPEVRERYLDLYEYHRLGRVPFLGTVHKVRTSGRHIIWNAITQEFYGDDGKRYVSYAAVEEALTALNEALRFDAEAVGRVQGVAMPLLGAGLAGGHWPTIAEIVQRVSTHFEPVVYTLDGRVPGF
jgi:O-acetyl-ADP-ribose deacetylase (regulator of RNase III)